MSETEAKPIIKGQAYVVYDLAGDGSGTPLFISLSYEEASAHAFGGAMVEVVDVISHGRVL